MGREAGASRRPQGAQIVATYQATVCDFACRALADAQCIVCGRDGCEKHLNNALGLVLVGLQEDATSLPLDQRPMPKLPALIYNAPREATMQARYARQRGESAPRATQLIYGGTPYVHGKAERLCYDCLRRLPGGFDQNVDSPELEGEMITKIEKVTSVCWREIAETLQVRESARRLGGKS
jgi:hypothetical protein